MAVRLSWSGSGQRMERGASKSVDRFAYAMLNTIGNSWWLLPTAVFGY